MRLLTNLETEKSKLIQVVLFGQPELDGVLEEPSIRQLRQRITFAYEILPLTKLALEQYLAHRLSVAGNAGPSLFAPKALEVLHLGSRGIPRLVNIIAHKALMAAFGTGAARVETAHVKSAIADTHDARRCNGPARHAARQRLRWLLASFGLCLVASAGLAATGFDALLGILP